MANAQRRKGLRGEAEVAAIWRSHGFDVLNLEGGGDQLVSKTVYERDVPKIVLHAEVKRENRLRLAWLAQAIDEAGAIATPLAIWRPDHWPWCVMLQFEDLARLLA